MPEQNQRHPDLFGEMMRDPRSPFFERDLRDLRWQLTWDACVLATNMARVELAHAFESLARGMRPKVDINSARLS